jgi:hypothetical protein
VRSGRTTIGRNDRLIKFSAIQEFFTATACLGIARAQSKFASIILVLPETPIDSAVSPIDLKAILSHLAEMKVITEREWFNGLALRIEVRQGGGGCRSNLLM